jgi:hypothetical protein
VYTIKSAIRDLYQDLGATIAVALLKLGLATSFADHKYPGFAKDVEEKRQRVLSAMMPRH